MKIQKNAITVSWVLIAIIIVLAIVISASFTVASGVLQEQAMRTNHAKIDNELAEQDIAKLKNLNKYLQENQATVNRASEVVAESQAYTYQNQGIADLNSFADQSGVKITGIDFPDASKQPAQQKSNTITGVKRIPIVVRLDGPVAFTNYLRFIKSIEQNLTKMQITSVAMTPDSKEPTKLITPSLNIEVYIR